ncbi:hypothetical protein [Thermostaphylospora chromogena]|uniref:Uncharacterized protein n=1 Tax=Thermostaphylospora chromogena TaxID=35622 RepID=A0A1H1HWH3_9ACTN|nr:hypothetical protein [Thermostaphylospora chromogena]SDR29426.1 hypothetical protein SAMN04489764_4869 [Thermostaphylospora chromogena]
MSEAPIAFGFVAHYAGRSYAAALSGDPEEVVLFSEEPVEGFTAAAGYWRRTVPRTDLSWLVLVRTVASFGGEPCVVLDEDDDGLHIAYTGHNGLKAEALGYWPVDHGAYEVVVPREEVLSIRVERVPVPLPPEPEREG